MVRYFLFTFFLSALIFLPAGAQRDADWGVIGGVTNYIGDINPDNLFHSPGFAAGIFYRYNIHPRHSLRASFMGGRLSANDAASSNSFQTERGESFSGNIGEMGVVFEFNFFPYTTASRKPNASPYLSAGAAIAFIDTKVFTYTPVIPFSLGLKLNFYKNIGLEIEYGFRKTFYDNFDGLIDPVAPEHSSWMHNNDWYSFAGIAFTWKMHGRLLDCPAYGNTGKYRRHY